MNITVESLRKSGHKVRVVHTRYNQEGNLIPYSRKKKGEVSPKGGVSEVEVTFPDGSTFESEALCSKKDHFCYGKGVAICLGRIFKQKFG